MMEDSEQEVTRESWSARIGAAFKGILFGLVLAAAAFFLLCWNEGRAVRHHKFLKEGAASVISIRPEDASPARSGRLVHVTGKADTDAVLTDPDFGISVNAIKLKRRVEMYQWKETPWNQTDGTADGGREAAVTFAYSRTWSEHLIPSERFRYPTGHRNPGRMPWTSRLSVAPDVRLGAFVLPPMLVDKIDAFTPLDLGTEASGPALAGKKAYSHDGGVYIGDDPASPRVGDIRVGFTVVRPMTVSVIARQAADTFEPGGPASVGAIALVETGEHAPDAMIRRARTHNRIWVWLLRGSGFILMAAALNMILNRFSVIADLLPFLGRVIASGTGMLSFLLAGALSLVAVAAAWMMHYPLFGAVLVLAAGGLAVWFRWRLKRPAVAAS